MTGLTWVRLFELDNGDTVAVGPFDDDRKALAYSDRLEGRRLAEDKGLVELVRPTVLERQLTAAAAAHRKT